MNEYGGKDVSVLELRLALIRREMAWRGHQNDIPVDQKPNSFVRSFTGVFEALAVLLCCFVHYIVIRVLRRSGLDAPCSCPARFRKHVMPTMESTIGLKENNRADHFGSVSKKAALKSCAESTTTGGAVDTRNSMANSRCEAGGNDSQSGYSSPVEDLSDRGQRDIDNDQDLKDKELLEALQRERETLSVLYSELEQERNCSATAASEALAMISRLQEEKAAVQMEARQFERMVLEKAMYDQEAIEALNELLVSREEEKLALEEEIRVCRENLDAVMREERRQSLLPKIKADEGRVFLKSESPIMVKNDTTPRAGIDEQSKYVDKFSTTNSQLLTALVQDRGRGMEAQLGLRAPNGIRRKGGKSEETDDGKPEFPGFVNLKRRWGTQEVTLKTLEQTKEERRIEDERRLSVLEYVMKFEQQQRGIRLPVQMHSVTKPPKSTGESRSKTRSDDVGESAASVKSGNDEPTSRVLTSDDSLRRRLFEEVDCGEEKMVSISSSVEEVEDGGRCDERPSCMSAYENELRAGEECKGTDDADECAEKSVFVHDVYEVPKSPYRLPAPVMGDSEMQPATPSDRLGKPDLQTFESDEERDYLCMIHPSHLHEEVEDAEKDSQWEDLQGKVRYKTLRVSKSLRIRDSARLGVEEEVQELTHRLQALEADKYFMKQTIEALRRENVEMKLLQGLSQQSLELPGMEQQELWHKRMPMTLQIQVFLQMPCRLYNISL